MLARIKERIQSLFASEKGEQAFVAISDNFSKQARLDQLSSGVAVGFSGGADSVLLLCFLFEYRRRYGRPFPLLAVHVNHGIRGDEAERDSLFAKEFAEALDVEFLCVKRDVPSAATRDRIGLEEAARNERYSVFEDIIFGRDDILHVALAHNATDNLETVLLNLMRGSGIVGMCGIPPVRDVYIRPLISISGADIRSLLDTAQIPYVTDSTNLCEEYSRNYVRHSVIPGLVRLSGSPEAAVFRMTENMRKSLDFIRLHVSCALERIGDGETFDAERLRELHPAVFAGVFTELVKARTGIAPDEKHINEAQQLLKRDNFALSLSGERDFLCQRGKCFFAPKGKKADSGIYKLNMGENNIGGYDALVHIGEKFDKTYSNIYNSAIQVRLPSGIIDDGLYLRFKKDGDSYSYRGITRKLKKVFNDSGLLPVQRQSVPVVCDSKGILWVPGLPLRDGLEIGERYVILTLLFGSGDAEKEKIYTVPDTRGKRKTNQKGLEDT